MYTECAIVGAGPAGIAAAGALARRGAQPLLVERGDVAASWRARYDRVHLNTSTWFSHLPGEPFPLRVGRFPSRDELVAYYERYVQRRGLEVRRNTEVLRVVPADQGWALETADEPVYARRVVVATGKDHTPIFPAWPGREGFTGELLHAAAYRNASQYRGQEALVVGVGNSGCEIALDLSEGGATRVRLAMRTPPSLTRRSVAGIPNDAFAIGMRPLPPRFVDELAWWVQRRSFGDLSAYGFTRPPEGVYTRLRRKGTIPTIDTGTFTRAVRHGRIEVVAGVERFEGKDVVLADGSRLSPGLVVAATGYRRNLEPLVAHLGVLDGDGRPLVHGPETHPRAPALHFIGFTDPISGNIRETRLVAKRLARSVINPPAARGGVATGESPVVARSNFRI